MPTTFAVGDRVEPVSGRETHNSGLEGRVIKVETRHWGQQVTVENVRGYRHTCYGAFWRLVSAVDQLGALS